MTTVIALRINEEYASLVPKISEAQYQPIKQDIKENGQHVPIIIDRKGSILDGLTRYRICQELGIEPKTMLCNVEYEDPLLAKQLIININRNRRDLTAFQKIELEARLEPIEAELAKRRQIELAGTRPTKELPKSSTELIGETDTLSKNLPKVTNEVKGRVIDIASSKARVSSELYRQGRYLLKVEPPEIIEKLRTGKLKIHKVYGRRIKQEHRDKLIEQAEKITQELPSGIKLICGDMIQECENIPDNSIDCIFTDPPYDLESVPIYAELGKVAARVLKPGASLVTIVGSYCLPQVMDLLRQSGLKYNWFCYMRHSGATLAMHGNHAVACGKVILWFCKGDKLIDTGRYVADFMESEAPNKSLHEWAQSTKEADHFLSRLVVENQTVLDPFMGSGTTGIAALNLKTQFIGIEIDKEKFDRAEARIRLAASHSEKEMSA
ncbi:MAG: hypothetical protein M3P08_07650 [Thermoproteota archaeon]|nr:hypothetical protein [Thermoproteota archaeon]